MFDLVVDRVMNYVGAYWTKLEGEVDALVFAGGIGEKSPQLRARITEKCRCLGVDLHDGRNLTNDTKEVRKTVRSIGEGRMKLLVVRRTNSMKWPDNARLMRNFMHCDSNIGFHGFCGQ